MPVLEFDVFGRRLVVAREGDRWVVYHAAESGKRRRARELLVPAELPAGEIERYLDDLCHEWSSARHPQVVRRR